jgi:hypothetical protein
VLINPGWINIRPSHSARSLRQITPPSRSAKSLRQASPPTDTAKRGAGQRAPSTTCDHSPLGGSVPSHRSTLIDSRRIGIQPSHFAKSHRQVAPPSHTAKPVRQASPPTDTAKRGAGQRAPTTACDHSPLGGSVLSHRRTLIDSGRIGIQPSHSAKSLRQFAAPIRSAKSLRQVAPPTDSHAFQKRPTWLPAWLCLAEKFCPRSPQILWRLIGPSWCADCFRTFSGSHRTSSDCPSGNSTPLHDSIHPPVRNLSPRFRAAAASPPRGVEPQRPPCGSLLACLWVSHASSNWKPGRRAPLRKTPGSAPPETGRPECPPSTYPDYWQFKPNSGVIPAFFDSFCRPRPNPDETVPIRQSPSGDNSHSRGSR